MFFPIWVQILILEVFVEQGRETRASFKIIFAYIILLLEYSRGKYKLYAMWKTLILIIPMHVWPQSFNTGWHSQILFLKCREILFMMDEIIQGSGKYFRFFFEPALDLSKPKQKYLKLLPWSKSVARKFLSFIFLTENRCCSLRRFMYFSVTFYLQTCQLFIFEEKSFLGTESTVYTLRRTVEERKSLLDLIGILWWSISYSKFYFVKILRRIFEIQFSRVSTVSGHIPFISIYVCETWHLFFWMHI